MKKAAKTTAKAKATKKLAVKAKVKSAAKGTKQTKAAPKKAGGLKSKSAARKASVAKSKPKATGEKTGKKKSAPANARPAADAKSKVPPSVAAPPAPVLSSSGRGTIESPWLLKTPAGFSEFRAYRDPTSNPPAIVVNVGSTELRYHLRCLDDLHQMLKSYGDWMQLGSADEQQPVMEGTVEAWARSPSNPIGGFYGLTPGLRGRFATYIPQVMEVLGLAEVEHFPNNNRMRAK